MPQKAFGVRFRDGDFIGNTTNEINAALQHGSYVGHVAIYGDDINGSKIRGVALIVEVAESPDSVIQDSPEKITQPVDGRYYTH